MMWGCPAEGVLLNFVCSFLVGAWIGMGTLWELGYWIVLIPTVHFVMRYGASRDHNWFRTQKLGIETKGFGTVKWGGSTVTPIPAGRATRAKDLALAY